MVAVPLVSPGDYRAFHPADSDDTPTYGGGQARREVRAGLATRKIVDAGIDVHTAITLDFGDACFAHVDASFYVLSSQDPRAEIYGSNG